MKSVCQIWARFPFSLLSGCVCGHWSSEVGKECPDVPDVATGAYAVLRASASLHGDQQVPEVAEVPFGTDCKMSSTAVQLWDTSALSAVG